MMDGFERRKQKKMEQIFTAAFSLMATYGYAKVSINEIATEARVSPATIFNYFGTKEKLYKATLDHWIEQQLSAYEEVLYSDRPFPEKVADIFVREAKQLKAFAHHTSAKNGVDASPWQMILESSEEKVQTFFLKVIEIGKQEGYIATAYSVSTMQRYFSMYMNELTRCFQEEDNDDISRQIDELLHLFFYGLVEKQ
ncbi:TetR/AcrR family transcriptional regulator [Halalkalibacterium halodurans]|jgi:AcrR family transcriptional regulator|nr:TetR/AcrR family transcriptional regulator [Halalkalibacterium halodurans]MED3647138.1 TetR/AcrR family transcriptional regulator [Halalkalibacterium halodurans]TPE68648.1 TetR/AcrR family transcriptional regulator [Halalkalibacterium halodurans]